jgi:hypothetical protein
MRSCTHLPPVLLLLLIVLLAMPAAARANNDDNQDEPLETARVARVSLLRGEVDLCRAGNNQWESASPNLPLVEGDTIATGPDARFEIQIDDLTFVRVGPDSVLRLATLRDGGVALSLTVGVVTASLAGFDHEREFFEIDGPQMTVAAERGGSYRLDAGSDGRVGVTVRGGGRARIYSETSGFTLRDGRRAELIAAGDEAGDWDLLVAPPFDEWDQWTDERERRVLELARNNSHREAYHDPNVWATDELDAYGDWINTEDYDWVWRPRPTVINSYPDWAPYRYGRWRWCPPYGWTWVADEPWGWAPYHYGRWVYYRDSWCWVPRARRQGPSRWRPALVVFVNMEISRRRHIAWYPLPDGQRDPRLNRWPAARPDNPASLGPYELADRRRVDPVYQRAVSALPERDFGAAGARAISASTDIAQRVIAAEPMRGRLSIRPTTVAGTARAPGAQRLPRNLLERPTGATIRRAGAPLDEELRRMRIFNSRAPRRATLSGGASGTSNDPSTGAVQREARPPARRRPIEAFQPPDARSMSPGRRPEQTARPIPPNGPHEEQRPATNEKPAPAAAPPVPDKAQIQPSTGNQPPTGKSWRRFEQREASNGDARRPRTEQMPEGRSLRDNWPHSPAVSERPRPRQERPASPPPAEPSPRREASLRERPPQRTEPTPRAEQPRKPTAPPRRAEPPPERPAPARNHENRPPRINPRQKEL